MRVKRLTESAKLPTKANPGDVGYDLYAISNYTISAGGRLVVRTGIAIEFPDGLAGIIKDRSSVATNGLVTHAGVIDSGYRGEIMVLLQNISKGTHFIGAGQKIAQLILMPVIDLDIEETTEPLLFTIRGGKGFGSSGT